MAHPYAKYGEAKMGKARVQAITKDGGGAVTRFPMSPAKTADTFRRLKDAGEFEKPGAVQRGRDYVHSAGKSWGMDKKSIEGIAGGPADMVYAKGGRTKAKGPGKVNVNIVIPQKDGGTPPPLMPPVASGPVPGRLPQSPVAPAGGAPNMPPPPMKKGGRIKMTGGAEGGVGRLQKAANAKRMRGG